ncbi:MAG: ABC transporter permease [Anaerolineales bacterium]|nr:ABC transporter permease [Chloroflexota bacterium]MBL6980640.1 ABC transporter permease [Anaerolineales bacterium]
MKSIDIALKDMLQSFRSLFAVMFMFVIPILMTGMFSLMFGGSGNDEEGFVLPTTKVILVNQDEGSFAGMPGEVSQNPEYDASSIGQLLTMALTSEGLTGIMDVSMMDSSADARFAVDNQEAGVAIIIPKNLTTSFLAPLGTVAVEVYQDPTLSIGPAIIKGIVSQLLDNFSASKITLAVTLEQIENSGQMIDEAQIQAVVAQYLATIQPEGQSQGSESANPYLDIRAPKTDQNSSDQTINPVAMIMAGMSIFYVYLTGASGTQTILKEEEDGTLPRLFSTPTPTATILRGKFLSVTLTIIVQITVLLVFGELVFKIHWGDLLSVALLSIAITLSSAAFGIFLVSFMKSTRQAGIMIGGVVTILGMAGMMPIFTLGMPNPPAFISIISHLAPQGWAAEGLQVTMSGGVLSDVWTNILALLVWAVALFGIGVYRVNKRYK